MYVRKLPAMFTRRVVLVTPLDAKTVQFPLEKSMLINATLTYKNV